MQARLQTAGSEPMGFHDPALACTRPVQSENTPASVIAGKIKIPKAEQDSRSQCVNEDQTPHIPEMHLPGFGVRPPDNTFLLPFHLFRGYLSRSAPKVVQTLLLQCQRGVYLEGV